MSALAPPPPAAAHLLSYGLGRGPLDGQLARVLYARRLLGEAEVADLGDVVVGHQHVAGGQVPVHEVVGLQVLHGFAHVTGRTQRDGRHEGKPTGVHTLP